MKLSSLVTNESSDMHFDPKDENLAFGLDANDSVMSLNVNSACKGGGSNHHHKFFSFSLTKAMLLLEIAGLGPLSCITLITTIPAGDGCESKTFH